MLESRVTLDTISFGALKKALETLPQQYRTKFLLEKQRKAVRPMQARAKQIAMAKSGSSTLAASIRTVNGKYAKRNSQAYVVIEHADRQYMVTRTLGSYTMPYKQNYRFVSHLIIGNTKSGVREVGKRSRKRRDGSSYIGTGNKNSRNFIVVDGSGRWMRRKKIRHPGTQGLYYFDEAKNAAGKGAINAFQTSIFKELASFKKKNNL